MNVCDIFWLDIHKHRHKVMTNLIERDNKLIDRIMPRLQADAQVDGRKEMWHSMSIDLKKLFLRDAHMRWPNEFKKEKIQTYCDRYEDLPYESLDKFFQLIYTHSKEAFEACTVQYSVESLKNGYLVAHAEGDVR